MAIDLIIRFLGALFPRYHHVQQYFDIQCFDAHMDRIHQRQMGRAEWKCYYHFERKRRRMLRQDGEEYWAWVKRNL